MAPKPRKEKVETLLTISLVNSQIFCMMTGLEIAGLVLAVIPIVASAADHQRKVYGAVNTALRSRLKNERLANQYQHLHNEVALLHLTIRHVVSGLPTLSASDKEQLFQLNGQLLKDGRLGLALSQTLGDASEAFVDTLNSALKCLDDILSDRVLKLEKADVVVGIPAHCIIAKLIFVSPANTAGTVCETCASPGMCRGAK